VAAATIGGIGPYAGRRRERRLLEKVGDLGIWGNNGPASASGSGWYIGGRPGQETLIPREGGVSDWVAAGGPERSGHLVFVWVPESRRLRGIVRGEPNRAVDRTSSFVPGAALAASSDFIITVHWTKTQLQIKPYHHNLRSIYLGNTAAYTDYKLAPGKVGVLWEEWKTLSPSVTIANLYILMRRLVKKLTAGFWAS
jgi:hypothetical protein